MKYILYIVIFMIVNLISCSSSNAKTLPSIHFSKNSFEDILNKAKKENKLIMVFIYSNYGSWCDKMRNETFKNKKVLSLLKKNYISVQFDKIEDEIDIPDEALTHIVPSIFLIDPKTIIVLDKSIGYISGKNLADKLDETIYFYNN